jgi:hypothetical protein
MVSLLLLALLILLNNFGPTGNLRTVVGMKLKEIAAQIRPWEDKRVHDLLVSCTE